MVGTLLFAVFLIGGVVLAFSGAISVAVGYLCTKRLILEVKVGLVMLTLGAWFLYCASVEYNYQHFSL